jgi:hypothetical protein
VVKVGSDEEGYSCRFKLAVKIIITAGLLKELAVII